MPTSKFADEVSRRYARALFDLAQEKNSKEALSKDMDELLRLKKESPELNYVFGNPLISDQKLDQIITKLFEGRMHPLLFTFLRFLIRKRKLNRFFSIADAFIEIYQKDTGILRVKLISVKPLKKEQIDELTKKLKNHFKKEIFPQLEQDPALIGGFQVQVGDQIFDYSIQTQLERFRKKVLVSS